MLQQWMQVQKSMQERGATPEEIKAEFARWEHEYNSKWWRRRPRRRWSNAHPTIRSGVTTLVGAAIFEYLFLRHHRLSWVNVALLGWFSLVAWALLWERFGGWTHRR